MKVGVCEALELKERSEKLELSFADTLYGYMIEDTMLRIYGSPYQEYIWLESRNVLGVKAYRERSEKQLRFLYQPVERTIASEKLCPGQTLSVALCRQMMMDLFAKDNAQGIDWRGDVTQCGDDFYLQLTGTYKEMQVPLCLVLHSVRDQNQRPGRRECSLSVLGERKLAYLAYAPENQLSRDLFEIVNKLELIGDMGCYDRAYQVLRKEPLSGRYVLEEFGILSESCSQVRKMQRLTQLEEYESYAYMRKRWEKYVRNRGVDKVPWSQVLQLILAFLTPVWQSLCENTIFFDDWMPELGRFLG